MATNNQRLIISNTHAGAQTIAFMYGLADGGTLDHQTRLRIALYLAQRGLSVFPAESLRECGRAAGMNGAEMLANQQGTSHDFKGTACLRFVQAMVDHPLQGAVPDTREMLAAGFSQPEILEVLAQVGMNALLARMSMVIAAPGEIVNCGQAGSRGLHLE